MWWFRLCCWCSVVARAAVLLSVLLLLEEIAAAYAPTEISDLDKPSELYSLFRPFPWNAERKRERKRESSTPSTFYIRPLAFSSFFLSSFAHPHRPLFFVRRAVFLIPRYIYRPAAAAARSLCVSRDAGAAASVEWLI